MVFFSFELKKVFPFLSLRSENYLAEAKQKIESKKKQKYVTKFFN
jgi:hypothetical protein